MKEILYLNIKAFTRGDHKLISDTIQTKDGMNVLRIIDSKNDKNLLKLLFERNNHSQKVS